MNLLRTKSLSYGIQYYLIPLLGRLSLSHGMSTTASDMPPVPSIGKEGLIRLAPLS